MNLKSLPLCFNLFCSSLLFLSACVTNVSTNTSSFQHKINSGPTPWTHEKFDIGDNQFTFAIFSDLSGSKNDRIFEIAMEQLSILRPELIMSVGDLITGSSENRNQLGKLWDEFDNKSAKTIAPIFYVGGNTDLTNPVMRDLWIERYGARYYHFIYKNVLFLILDSEDFDEQRLQEIYHARVKAFEIRKNDPDRWSETEFVKMKERYTGSIRSEQADYILKAIADNPDVRWTFVFIHKQVWRNKDATEFQAIEAALDDRPYTVFSGHIHSYSLNKRYGRDYIVLGTTSGVQNPRDNMSFDHLTLVRMTDNGPSIVNLKMDGILDNTGHIPLDGDGLCYQASNCASVENKN